MNIDLDAYFDTTLPTVTVFGKVYEVDNDYKKVLAAQYKFSVPYAEADYETAMRELLADNLKGGRQAAEEILAHNMPFAFWNTLQLGVMAAMTGKTVEELRNAAEKAPQDAQFRPAGRGTKKRL